jgi:phage terminase small subunit
MNDRRLSPKQALFIEEYLIDLNATAAAIRAGYAKSTADKQASLWVGKSRDSCPEKMRHVWDAVQDAKSARIERTQVDADYVLRRLVEIDEMDVADILDDGGNLLAVKCWPKAWRTSISGLDINTLMTGDIETIARKIKMPDKLKNLELIGKHITVQAFKDRLGYEDENLKTLEELLSEVRDESFLPGEE